MEDLKLCPSCHKVPETKPHVCPLRADLDDDLETLCTCCHECQHQCFEDI